MQAEAEPSVQEEAHQLPSCHKFRGESLWEPFQLEEEMAKGYWICVRPSGSYLHNLWSRQMQLVLRYAPPNNSPSYVCLDLSRLQCCRCWPL